MMTATPSDAIAPLRYVKVFESARDTIKSSSPIGARSEELWWPRSSARPLIGRRNRWSSAQSAKGPGYMPRHQAKRQHADQSGEALHLHTGAHWTYRSTARLFCQRTCSSYIG